MWKRALEESEKLVMILVGIALNACAAVVFCLPYNILIGGVTGIGRLIQHFTGLNISTAVLIVSMILLLLALILLGKRYAATIVMGSFAYPFFLGLFELLPVKQGIVEDPLVACLCGGFLMGVGIGLVIRAGGSLGGSDVMVMILHRKARLPIGPVMWGIDVTVLLLQCFLATPNEVILGIIMVLTYTIVSDKTLLAGGGQVQFMIFSPKNDEIRQMLIDNHFGATVLHGKSGYFSEEVDVLVTALSLRFMNRVKDNILAIDDKAFMTISSVREVDGRGFTLSQDA